MTALKLIMGTPSADSEIRTSPELFAALGKVTGRLTALDSQRIEAADEATVAALTTEVAELLADVLATLEDLEKSATADEVDDDFADEEPQTWVGFRPPVEVQPSRIEDVCFVASFELGRALRTLQGAAGLEARSIAAESAIRKLHRVLYAVMAGAERLRGASLQGTEPLRRRLGAELESALAVRRLYVSFRRALRRPENDSREAVLTALRYAAGGLATIAASPHYHSVRLSDRTLLLHQRDRLLDWAHAGKPTQAGVQLLEDLFTCADLLKDINRRQELRAHDLRLIRELVGDTTREREDWLLKLERLAGLDGELDELTAQLRKSPDMGPVIDIIVRLSLLVG
ncbi:MAG: hypothetical protein EOO73_22105 [Myxococcales bacterium]|nr:MAG: hypothetical protein EOO73_22105 [Myxococcales bacterium]